MTACAIPRLSYGAFSARLHDRVVLDRVPVDGTMELTYRCNLACTMCYCNLPAGDLRAQKREMSTDEVRRILDEVAEAGCLWMLFTGGEVLIRPDFLEIYRHAVGNGLIIQVFSNGIGMTERIADALAEFPPFKVEITLYGATARTYERLTRRPRAFELCLRGIRLLLDRGIPLSLKATVTNENAHELKAMRRIARDLGLEFYFTGELNGRIDERGSMDLPVEKRLTPAEVVALDLADPDRVRKLEKLFSGALGSLGRPHETLWPCFAGISGFTVNPYGRLVFCPQIEFLGHDLGRVPFQEAWRRFSGIRRMKPKRPRPCNACELNVVCAICPGTAYAETRDIEGKIEFMDEVARLRAEAFGLMIHKNELGGIVIDGRKKEALHSA